MISNLGHNWSTQSVIQCRFTKILIFINTKYCVIYFRNVQFPKSQILMKEKYLWKSNTFQKRQGAKLHAYDFENISF